MIKEYGELTDKDMSVKCVILTGKMKHDGRPVYLVSRSAGFEPAGSCARYTNDVWAVEFELDGARHGRRFTTLKKAHELYLEWAI